jgi:hypothetical protein
MAKRRRHSLGEISCHTVDKKPRRQTNKQNQQNQPTTSQSSQSQTSQASQSVYDDILDLVATGGGGDSTADGAAALSSDASIATAVTAATLQAGQNESAPLGVASTVMDYAVLEKLVSQCVAAQVAPMSAAITTLLKELQQTKQAVVKLSKEIGEMATAKSSVLASAPAAGTAGAGVNKTSPAGSAAPLSHAAGSKVAGAAQSPSRSNQPADQNSSRSAHRNRSCERQLKQDAVTAMYVDLNKKQRRANNIVISGLPPSDCDAKAATEFLRAEFEWDFELWPGVSVVQCRRLGKPQENKVQPLLVTLHNREQAEYYIRNAKLLRSSLDDWVKENVFINADMTPSEAKAAYELRVKRREKTEGQQQPGIAANKKSAGRTFYRRPNNTAALDATSDARAVEVEADLPRHAADDVTPVCATTDRSMQDILSYSMSTPPSASVSGLNVEAPSFQPPVAPAQPAASTSSDDQQQASTGRLGGGSQ